MDTHEDDSRTRRFAALIALLASTFGVEVSALMLEGYALGLQDLSADAIEHAVNTALRKATRMPAPAKLREYAASYQQPQAPWTPPIDQYRPSRRRALPIPPSEMYRRVLAGLPPLPEPGEEAAGKDDPDAISAECTSSPPRSTTPRWHHAGVPAGAPPAYWDR